ncbi:acetyl-CoA carboxylase biotin carboxyl carrier protein [Candidatus Poribacteria bacterium]|nr:acetyl-CoA carboxylase biotin carboxyl carrier protein [Candidatus Poribacteria bacterium]
MSEDKSPAIIDLLQKVCDIMESRELAEVYLREGEMTLRVRRGGAGVPAVFPYAGAAPPTESVEGISVSPSVPSSQKTGELIKSPMPGVFYLAPSPEEPPFVEVGSVILENDTLCVIEAMKIFNEVKADFPCEILEILVEDAAAVGFDHPLFRVKRM